jgi:integrase
MPRPADLVLATPAQPLTELVERAREYAADSRATSTKKAYLSDFASFEAWCTRQGVASAPTTPATVAVYLAALADAGRKASTIERALAGIAWAQRTRGHEWFRAHPAIVAVMTGIRRRNGTAPTQKAPVVDQELAALVATLDDGLRGLRDRSLLTMGWFGAFRRSELVALDVSDVTKEREGLVVAVRRSKRDQEGRGAEKGIPYASNPGLCPVRALAAWLEAARIESGPIFRGVHQLGRVATEALSDRSVARIV